MEAIYLLTPVPNSIKSLIEDFSGIPLYKNAHVYFTEGDHLHVPKLGLFELMTNKVFFSMQ